jgi:hypothetical protein
MKAETDAAIEKLEVLQELREQLAAERRRDPQR